MKGTTKIKELGIIKLEGVEVKNGRLEVHIPIENISNQFDATLDNCYENFKKKHPKTKENQIFHSVKVVFSCGGSRNSLQYEVEFMLLVIVWDGENDSIAEYYGEIMVELDEEESKKLRELVWYGLGEMLFGT